MASQHFTPALCFAIAANLTTLGIGLITGGSLLIACIFLAITQLIILLVGGVLWARESKNLNWRRGVVVLLLLFTPYVVGLGAASIMHQRKHDEMEAEATDGSKARAIGFAAPVSNP